MQLFSKIIGEGQPIVILHGLFGMSDNWLTIGKNLAGQGFALHLLDLRNHGRSPHASTHSYLDICDDLLLYLLQQNLRKVHLIGHSMGGKAAMFFGLLHPDRVRNLAVIDIAPTDYGASSRTYHEDIIRNIMEIDVSLFADRRSVMAALESRITDPATARFLGKSLMRESTNTYRWKLNLPILLQHLPELTAGIEKVEGWAPSPIRTLFVRGEHSSYILPEHDVERKKYFPKSSMLTITGAGHWIHIDQPEKLSKVLAAFLV